MFALRLLGWNRLLGSVDLGGGRHPGKTWDAERALGIGRTIEINTERQIDLRALLDELVIAGFSP